LSHCGVTGEPFRIGPAGRAGMRKCRRQTGLTVGTVMERSHTPLSTWFWAAYLVATQTPECPLSVPTATRALALRDSLSDPAQTRAGMVRPHQDRIGGRANEHVEVDETWVGGRTRGEGRGVHHKVLVACAVEARHRKPGTAQDKRKDGAMQGAFGWRSPLTEAPDRFVNLLMAPLLRDADRHRRLERLCRSAKARLRSPRHRRMWGSEVTEEFLPITHLVFANLKTWLSVYITGQRKAPTSLPQ